MLTIQFCLIVPRQNQMFRLASREDQHFAPAPVSEPPFTAFSLRELVSIEEAPEALSGHPSPLCGQSLLAGVAHEAQCGFELLI